MKRTRKEVITAMFMALHDVDFVGIAIEPIPTVLDPDDEIQGDTVLNVSMGIEFEGKFMCTSFRITFVMDEMRDIGKARFERNMTSLNTEAKNYLKRPAKDHVILATPGVSSIAEALRAAEVAHLKAKNATKH